jgi:energy-coupling factor transporter ATP-binding protein EcfA2
MEREIEDFLREIGKTIKEHPFLSIFVTGSGVFYWQKQAIREWISYIQLTHGESLGQLGQLLLRLGLGLTVIWIVLLIVHFVLSERRFQYVQLLPHEEDTYAFAQIITMVRTFYYIPQPWWIRLLVGKPRYSFIIKKDTEGLVTYYLGADKGLISQAVSSFASANYKHIEVFEEEKLRFISEEREKKRFGFHLRQAKRKPLPFKKFTVDIATILAEQLPKDASIQIMFENYPLKTFRQAMNETEKDTMLITEQVEAKEKMTRQKELLRDMGKRFESDEVIYKTSIGFVASGKESKVKLFDVFNTIAATMNDSNRLKRRRNKRAVQTYPRVPEKVLLTGSELANLVHLPQLASDKLPEETKKMIPHGVSGIGSLPNDVMNDPEDLQLGVMQHPVIKDRKVFIQSKFIGEHFVVTGNTGSGKSTVLNTLINEGFLTPFIESNGKPTPGLTFIDPARDTAITFFNWLLRAETLGETIQWEKVHYFKIAHGKYPIGINLLGRIEGVTVDAQADAISEIIENVFENKAEVAARLLRFCIKTLLADEEVDHTILEVPKLVDDEDYREELLGRLDASEYYDLLNYWHNDAEENIKTSATALKNRIDLFSTSSSMKRIFGQQDNNLEVKRYMEEGHFVFFDASNLGEKEINIFSSYVSYLYYRIAETRNIGANLHLLAIDEAHRVGDVFILPKIVAESRKFGFSLGISTQRLAQLSKELRDTLTEVQNNFFVCRQGSKDSKVAADNIGTDLVKPILLEKLEKREVVVKYPFVYPNGVEEQQRFMVKVPPLDKYQKDGTVADFANKELIAAVDAWTAERAEKLIEDRGYLTSEKVDKAIYHYLNGILPKSKKSPMKKEEPVLLNKQSAPDEEIKQEPEKNSSLFGA